VSHPTSRAERRHQRERVIARRKFIATKIWSHYNEEPHEGSPFYQQQMGWYTPTEWGRYAKFNLNCGCTMCHSAKYFASAHKRRKALRQSWTQAEFRRRDKVEGR
jgi:hypothetical protein